jgi:mRNA interferase RelE/StbE
MNGPYRVILSLRAQRDLDRLPRDVLLRVRAALDELAQNPRGPGTKKLTASGGIYRKRCGEYRILYEIDDANHEVTVHRVAKRDDAY